MCIQDEAQLGALPYGPSQESFDLGTNVILPVAPVLQVSLPKVIGQQQGVFLSRADDIRGGPEKASDRNRKKWIRGGCAVEQQSLVPAYLKERVARQAA
jgi:hypothetical protein